VSSFPVDPSLITHLVENTGIDPVNLLQWYTEFLSSSLLSLIHFSHFISSCAKRTLLNPAVQVPEEQTVSCFAGYGAKPYTRAYNCTVLALGWDTTLKRAW